MTPDQRTLLEDKSAIWRRLATEGTTDMRDYHRRCADALDAALATLAQPATREDAAREGPSQGDIDRAHKLLRSLRKPTINSNVPAAVVVEAMFTWHEQEKSHGR